VSALVEITKALQEAEQMLPAGHKLTMRAYRYYLTFAPDAPSAEDILAQYPSWRAAVAQICDPASVPEEDAK
jgi:hypothetical protein